MIADGDPDGCFLGLRLSRAARSWCVVGQRARHQGRSAGPGAVSSTREKLVASEPTIRYLREALDRPRKRPSHGECRTTGAPDHRSLKCPAAPRACGSRRERFVSHERHVTDMREGKHRSRNKIRQIVCLGDEQQIRAGALSGNRIFLGKRKSARPFRAGL